MNARRYGRHVFHALTALLAAALLLPALALAASTTGGGGLGGTTPVGTPKTSPTTANMPVSTSGDGLTLNTNSSSLLRHRLSFTGSAPTLAGRRIVIERDGRRSGWLWQAVASTTVAGDGSFTAGWKTNQAGQYAVRAVVAASDLAAAADATPSLTVTVYRQSKATLYGPGFYGNKMACGGRLTRATIGVANRTLPCGATVSLLYRGETISVPVIDRGPYANDADWDLTMATGEALGMKGTEKIGAVTLPKATAAARRTGPAPPTRGTSRQPVLLGAQTAGR